MIDHWLQELDFSYYSRCKQVRCVTGWSEKVASSMTWCKLLRSNLECSQSLWMEKPSSSSTQLLRQLKGSPKLFCASVDKEETDLQLQNAFVFRWQPPSMHQDTWEDLLQNLSCIIFSAQWLHCAVRRGTFLASFAVTETTAAAPPPAASLQSRAHTPTEGDGLTMHGEQV